MPPPSIGPFIPAPKDQFGEIGPAIKKATFIVTAVAAAQLLERRFPKTTGPLVHFVTGLETVKGRGIKIKPGFVAWAFPQPVGLVPPSMTGLPDITGSPLDLFDRQKIKESYQRLAREKFERDFVTIQKVIIEAEPALRERPIGFVATANRKVKARLEELGPKQDRLLIVSPKRAPVDERLFLEMMALSLENEIERRRREAPELNALVPAEGPAKDGGTIGYFIPEVDGRLDPILIALSAIGAFLEANPADP